MKPIPTLIADDSAMIVKIIKKALLASTADGFHFEENQIYTAADGMEAFEMIGAHQNVKLIICDINMPSLTGDELVEILKDTQKIKNIDVLFVTSTQTNMLHKPAIKDEILGVIYKPFTTENFNSKMQQLYIDKENGDKELSKLKQKHIKQKEEIYKIAITYLTDYSIAIKDDILNSLIDENFIDQEVEESEYQDIVHSSLSFYMLEVDNEHVVYDKKIRCIIRKLKNKTLHSKNTFNLIENYKRQLDGINEEELKPKELLNELTAELIEKTSIISTKAKKFPKQLPSRFSKHFEYIIEEFTKLDCDFDDDYFIKINNELEEIKEFNHWLHAFLTKGEISTVVKNIKKSPVLYHEVIKRLKNIYKKNASTIHHYTGELDRHIWTKAKKSKEVLDYIKQNMPKTIPNCLEFLLHKEKITPAAYKESYRLDRKNIVVISNNLTVLETFKTITDPPFDNWHFYAYAQLNMLDAWLKSNVPHMIVIDYTFKTAVIKNGIQLLRILSKKNRAVMQVVNDNHIFIIANANNLIEIKKNKCDVDYSVIDDKLISKEITQTLMYN